MAKRKPSGRPDALRDAIEQTFEATAGSATETRERAASLLDQLVGQGREAGRALEKQGAEARRFVGSRLQEAIAEIQKRLKP